MNKICKEYTGEVRKFFPVFGKRERTYFKSLKSDVESYCEENDITAKSQLYENYGKPNEVVCNYLSAVDIDYVVKKVDISKYIKAVLLVLLAMLLIITSVLSYVIYEEEQIKERQRIVISEAEKD